MYGKSSAFPCICDLTNLTASLEVEVNKSTSLVQEVLAHRFVPPSLELSVIMDVVKLIVGKRKSAWWERDWRNIVPKFFADVAPMLENSLGDDGNMAPFVVGWRELIAVCGGARLFEEVCFTQEGFENSLGVRHLEIALVKASKYFHDSSQIMDTAAGVRLHFNPHSNLLIRYH